MKIAKKKKKKKKSPQILLIHVNLEECLFQCRSVANSENTDPSLGRSQLLAEMIDSGEFDPQWLADITYDNQRDGDSGGRRLWQPENGDRESWLGCHGLPCDVWQNTLRKLDTIQHLEVSAECQ